MRPRRFCRGKPGARRASTPSTRRFNEAPAILPGKASIQSVLSHWPRLSFNEAPAILPGKAPPAAHRDPCSLCFNEAPAILPGKAHTGLSRRVRRFNSFNEAPAILPGKANPVAFISIGIPLLQ